MSQSDNEAYRALGPFRRSRVDARLTLLGLVTDCFGADGP